MYFKSICAIAVLGVAFKFTGLGDAVAFGLAKEYIVEQAAAEVNENPPPIDSEDLRFKVATPRGNVLSLELESSNKLARVLRGKDVRAQFQSSMNAFACNDRNISRLIRNGVNFEVAIETRRGKPVNTLLFDEASCV